MPEAGLPSDWRVSYRPYLLVDDEAWTVVDANYAAEEFWGYSPAQLMTLPLARLLDERGVERVMSAAKPANEREFRLLSLTMRQQSTAEHLIDLSAVACRREPRAPPMAAWLHRGRPPQPRIRARSNLLGAKRLCAIAHRPIER